MLPYHCVIGRESSALPSVGLTLPPSWFPRQEVEGTWPGSLLDHLKSRGLQETRPPLRAACAAVQEQGAEGELLARVFRDYHHQEFATGFQYARCFAQRCRDAVAVQVIDGVGAHDSIERGSLERQLAHVAGLNRGAPFQAGGFQVG